MKIDPAVAAMNLGFMRAASAVADHWVQTTGQAACKGLHDGDRVAETKTLATSAEGRKACAAHVASYVATQGGTVLAAARVCGVRLDPRWLAAGLALSGATHYWADRRRPLRKLAERVGKGPFYGVSSNGINGAYLLDQAFHHGVEAVASMVMSIGATRVD